MHVQRQDVLLAICLDERLLLRREQDAFVVVPAVSSAKHQLAVEIVLCRRVVVSTGEEQVAGDGCVECERASKIDVARHVDGDPAERACTHVIFITAKGRRLLFPRLRVVGQPIVGLIPLAAVSIAGRCAPHVVVVGIGVATSCAKHHCLRRPCRAGSDLRCWENHVLCIPGRNELTLAIGHERHVQQHSRYKHQSFANCHVHRFSVC